MAPPDLAPPTGSPAGYGKSCMNCSRAKCKCILRSDGPGCERCNRLGKDCQPMATARKRTSKKSTSSRTAQLEEKLEDLVSILRASQQQPSQQMSRQPSVDAASTPYTSRLDSLATAATVSSHQPRRDAFRCETQTLAYPPGNGPVFYEPSPQEAERRLGLFRGWLKNLPFMVLPRDMTVGTLRQEKPFLWMCINNITAPTVREQIILKDKIRAEVAQRIVIDSERNMDLFLGLLACMTWITMYIGYQNKPFMATYSQLALAIVSDLGLARTPGEEYYIMKHFKAWHGRIPAVKPRTLEERRGMIALWFLISTYSCITAKTQAAHWTSHLQEHLEYLEEQKDDPSDEVLIALVKTQLVSDETIALLVSEATSITTKIPGHVFKKELLYRLNRIREEARPRLGSHYAVQSHLLQTELTIHSLSSSVKANPDMSRIEGMYSCLQVVKAWYDVFFSVPLIELAGLPFYFFAALGQTLSALYRLATSEDPGWDKRTVYKEADVLVILEQVIQRLMEIPSAYPMEPDGEEGPYFEKIEKIMRSIKASWEPILTQPMGDMLTPNSQAVSNAATGRNPVEGMQMVPDPYAMDLNEIAWMSDVFGPWEL